MEDETMIVYKKRSVRQETNAIKSHHETFARIRMEEWKSGESVDWQVRLNALVQFVPGRSDRAILNMATIKL
jgi:hypothetical protein